MGSKNRTLGDTFGVDRDEYIKFVYSEGPEVVRIHKECFGEDMHGYNSNPNLNYNERLVVPSSKAKFKRTQQPKIDSDPESSKLAAFKYHVLRIYGKHLEEIFMGSMESVTYLLNNELKKDLDKKTTGEMIETLRDALKRLKENKNKFSEDQTLCSELKKHGFYNDKLNAYVRNKMSKQSQTLLDIRYSFSLNALNDVSAGDKRILCNVVLPLLFSRFKKYYKRFEARHLQTILGKYYSDFINSYLKTLSLKIQTLFQELYGRKYDTYIFDNNLNKEKLNEIGSIINGYLEEIKNKPKIEFNSTIKAAVPEERFKQSTDFSEIKSVAISEVTEKHSESEVIGIGSSFRLHLIDDMGYESYKDCIIVDREALDEFSKYEKILIYTGNARRLLGKSEGDTVLYKKGPETLDATIIKIYSKKGKSRETSSETINNYVDSAYLLDDNANQYRNNNLE